MRNAIPTRPTHSDPARTLHEAGMSCKTIVGYSYDANGRRRWCLDCKAPLGKPQDLELPTPRWAWVAVGMLVGLILLTVGFLAVRIAWHLDQPGPRVTPTTYGPPNPDHYRVPDIGTRPTVAA